MLRLMGLTSEHPKEERIDSCKAIVRWCDLAYRKEVICKRGFRKIQKPWNIKYSQ